MTDILFIEPDRVLAKTYHDYFTEKGFNLRFTGKAQDAIALADKITPDLVILELQLKIHNGIDFLYEFRSYPDWQDIPVIILTMVPPNEFPQDKEFWKSLKIHKYMYKPKIKLNSLFIEINELLAQKTS
jgi:DNA-binding response OmpR family regulator